MLKPAEVHLADIKGLWSIFFDHSSTVCILVILGFLQLTRSIQWACFYPQLCQFLGGTICSVGLARPFWGLAVTAHESNLVICEKKVNIAIALAET